MPNQPRPVSEVTRQKLREAGRRSGVARAYDVEAMFAAIRAHDTLQDAASALGILRKTVYNRLARLADRGALPPDIAARRYAMAGFPRTLTEAAREAMRAAGRRTGRGRPLAFDREEVFAVLRRSRSVAEAARELGIEPGTMGKRMQWLRAHDALPADLVERKWHRNGAKARAAIRRKRAAAIPVAVAPRKPAAPAPRPLVVREPKPAAIRPQVVSRPVAPPKPKEPEHVWQGPKRVVELPTPAWPAPLPAKAAAVDVSIDEFAARRSQLARAAAERSWQERHPAGVAG